MKHLNYSDVTRTRIAKWISTVQPVTPDTTWTERRKAIDIGGHTYIIQNGQIFACAKCGNQDPEWSATEIMRYFKDNMNIEAYDIEITCSVAIKKDE